MTPEGHRSSEWPRTLETFALCLLYVTAFWGQAARWLPAPLDQWQSVLYRAIGPWWHGHVATGLDHREQTALYQLVEAMFLAVLLPVWILRRNGYGLRNAGIALPDRSALGPGIAAILLSLPFGFYLSRAVPDPWGTPLLEGPRLLGVIPEHLLIFGVVGALLLPNGGLRAPVEGRRALMRRAFAVVATVTLFVLVHVGEHPAVLMASLPLGLINAYVTLRTASIWPAIAAHWLMNVVPMIGGMLRG